MATLNANAVELWDQIWTKEGLDGWRASDSALGPVYARIAQLTQPEARLIDLGGGCGDLAAQLNARGASVVVLDHSPVAVQAAQERGVTASVWNAAMGAPPMEHLDGVVSTEFLEHLELEQRDRVLKVISSKPAMLSVPNNQLGPEEEAQHTIKWTAKEFLDYLKGFWSDVRVECIGGYLLAVCGVPKSFTLSVCFPARDEAFDIERVLTSFRGVADELVVGIDPRSKDATEEIARCYADVVFTVEEPAKDLDGEDNVHFSHIRNQCIERCTGDWIFMTEAHESLQQGADDLLALGSLKAYLKVGMVVRRGLGQKFHASSPGAKEAFQFVQRWMFPWLWKRSEGYSFKRAKHNYLDFPESVAKKGLIWLPQVVTFHDRHETNAGQRDKQRKSHNRRDLFDDWRKTGSTNSLYYLASEWRGIDHERTISYFEQLLALPSDNGPRRYQARLILAKEYARKKLWKDAKRTLLGCIAEDWSRIDHWVFLGDLVVQQGKYEEALQWYLYADAKWMDMPLSVWWIDESFYTWLPQERLAQCYGELGELEKALFYARRARGSLPVDAPEDVLELHSSNIAKIEEALHGTSDSHP